MGCAAVSGGVAGGPQIKQLNVERSELEQQVESLKAKCDEIETKEAQRRASEEEKHAEEVCAFTRVVYWTCSQCATDVFAGYPMEWMF